MFPIHSLNKIKEVNCISIIKLRSLREDSIRSVLRFHLWNGYYIADALSPYMIANFILLKSSDKLMLSTAIFA